MRRIFSIVAMLAGLSAIADAHAFLQSAVPRVGSTASAVSELRLTFTEALEPAFSTVTLSRLDGASMISPKAQADQDDAKVLVVKLSQPLGEPPACTNSTIWRRNSGA